MEYVNVYIDTNCVQVKSFNKISKNQHYAYADS